MYHKVNGSTRLAGVLRVAELWLCRWAGVKEIPEE